MVPHSQIQATRRLRLLARLAVLWALVIFGRLVWLQVYRHSEYARQSVRQVLETAEIPAARGNIYDRHGQPLAISVPADTIVINPRRTPDLSVARDIFSPVLKLDPVRLEQRIDWARRHNRGYLRIKNKVSPEESRKLRSLKLDWIQFEQDSKRYYPNGPLAAQVIGTVDYEGRGNSGLELKLDAALRGQAGLLRTLNDARSEAVETEVLVRPRPGDDIGLSIDSRVQYVADQALKKAAEQYQCRSGSLVVLLPKTGEILALSNFPSFDPNLPVVSKADLERRTNFAVSVPFEPGSVFKVVTVAAALETTELTPDTPIDCGPGVLNLFGRRIHDIHAYGTLPVSMVLAKSSNIGAIQIGLRVGERRLLEYVRRLGFGRRTGIPLPGESPGKVRDLSEWRRTSIGSVAMGHEISATSLQLALAVAAVANGGLLPKPRLIRWRRPAGGKRVEEPVEPGRRVLRPETTIALRRMMERVVLEGTGRRARLDGYTCGGKTGSAQIFDPATGRYLHLYNASFVGFAPVADPRVVVAVTLNYAPKYGGIVAAPVFREVAQTALRILGVVPDIPVWQAEPEENINEDSADWNDVAIAELGGSSGRPAEAAALVSEQQPSSSPYLFGPTIPNLRGLTKRDVLEEASRLGVPVECVGAGLVRSQRPPPGTVLPPGQSVFVEFAQ